MPQPLEYGTATRVTGTGYFRVSQTGRSASLIGILSACSATAGSLQFFAAQGTASGSTSGATAISALLVFASGSVASYLSYPAFCSGGFDVNIGANTNPDITLFWNPA